MNKSHSLSGRLYQRRDHTLVALWQLMKPRVMSLAIFSALVGYLLAPHPETLSVIQASVVLLGVALGAGGAGAFNMWYERDSDRLMSRTRNRPLPRKLIAAEDALCFALGLAMIGTMLVALASNFFAAGWLLLAIVYYAVAYTIWLKPRTPENIVIGGGAGAIPPLIGWSAAGAELTLLPIILVLIIFLWTPPHFWSLALLTKQDYARAGIPSYPNVYGDNRTRIAMAGYAILLLLVGLSPVLFTSIGWIYTVAAAPLLLWFVVLCARVTAATARKAFMFSIILLFILLTLMVADSLIYSFFID